MPSSHFIRWSWVQACLATADLFSLAFWQFVLCSLTRLGRFMQVSHTCVKQRKFTSNTVYTRFPRCIYALSLCVQRDQNNLCWLILCEAGPIYGRQTEDWYSVFCWARRGIFMALSGVNYHVNNKNIFDDLDRRPRFNVFTNMSSWRSKGLKRGIAN